MTQSGRALMQIKKEKTISLLFLYGIGKESRRGGTFQKGDNMLGFFIGLLVGSVITVFLMALMFAASRDER